MSSLKNIIDKLESKLDLMTHEEQVKALDFIYQSQCELAKDDFYVFLTLVAPEIIPPPFVNGKHLFLYCNELERLERGVISGEKVKLQLFLPPGSMKTVTLCLFVAWLFGRHPDWYVLHIGHTLEFAEENFGQRIRDVLQLEIYKNIFPNTILSKTTRKKKTWKTTQGGTYVAAGAGNAIAGKRAHVSICDDILSEQTALSKIERNKINSWYVPGLRSRLMPTGCEVIVNTRWHLDDISGRIIALDRKAKQPEWRIIAIPAVLEGELGVKAAKLLGLPENGSFWPEFWTLEQLLEKKATNTPAMWNALYMQNPVPDDGNIFKKHHFRRWNTIEKSGLPKFHYLIISFDTAFSTKSSADYSAFGVYGMFVNDDGNFAGMMRLRGAKGHWSYPELKAKIIEAYLEYKPKFLIIEEKASGLSLLQDLILEGLPVLPYKPKADKEERANACVPFLEAGMIWVTDGDPETDTFLEELFQFPAGAHDDYVDEFTQAVLWMRDNNKMKLQSYGTIERNRDEDFDDEFKKPKERPSYWKATIRRRRY